MSWIQLLSVKDAAGVVCIRRSGRQTRLHAVGPGGEADVDDPITGALSPNAVAVVERSTTPPNAVD